MVELNLYPEIIPEVVTSLLSSDRSISDKTGAMLEQQLAEASSDQKAHSYMSNVVYLIRGKVAEVKDLGERLKARADDFDGINEEGLVVVGTLITAITQSGNISLMAVYSGVFAGGSKVAFKLAKGFYRDWWLKGKLQKGMSEALAQATEEATLIYNETYGANRNTNHVVETLQTKAKSFASTLL